MVTYKALIVKGHNKINLQGLLFQLKLIIYILSDDRCDLIMNALLRNRWTRHLE